MKVKFTQITNDLSHGVYITEIGGKRVPLAVIYRDPSRIRENAVYEALSMGLIGRITSAVMKAGLQRQVSAETPQPCGNSSRRAVVVLVQKHGEGTREGPTCHPKS